MQTHDLLLITVVIYCIVLSHQYCGIAWQAGIHITKKKASNCLFFKTKSSVQTSILSPLLMIAYI